MEPLYTLLGGALATICAFVINFYRARKSAKKVEAQIRQSVEEKAQELRQNAQEFIDHAYRSMIEAKDKVIAENSADRDELQKEINQMRKETSFEAHELRSQLQTALIQNARLEERNKFLETQVRGVEGKPK